MYERDRLAQRLAERAMSSRLDSVRAIYERAAQRRLTQLSHSSGMDRPEAFSVQPDACSGISEGVAFLGATLRGAPVAINAQARSPLLLIVGAVESGKSTIIERLVTATASQGVTAILVQRKRLSEYVGRHPLAVLSPLEAALPMGEPSPGLELDALLHAFVSVLMQVAYVYSGTHYILDVARVLAERDPRSLCAAAILHELQKRLASTKNFKQASHLDSACNAVRQLVGMDRGLFSSANPLPWDTLAMASRCLPMAEAQAEAIKAHVFMLLLTDAARASSVGHYDRSLRWILALDDARVFLTNARTPSGPDLDIFQHAQDVGHSAGQWLVAGCQTLQGVAEGNLSAADFVLVGPQDARDVQRIASRLQLNSTQAEYLVNQPPHHAVCLFRKGPWPWAFPVVLAGPEYNLDEDEAMAMQAEARKRVISGHAFERWSPPITPTQTPHPANPQQQSKNSSTQPSGLDPKSHSLVASVLRFPHKLQTEHGESINCRGRLLTKLRDGLVARGYIRVHRLRRFALLEPTDEGAAAIGMSKQGYPGVGSWAHRWLQMRYKVHLKKSYARVEIEHRVGSAAFDVYAESGSGCCIIEIVLSVQTLDAAIARCQWIGARATLIVPDATVARRAEQQLRSSLFVQAEVLTLQQAVKLTEP